MSALASEQVYSSGVLFHWRRFTVSQNMFVRVESVQTAGKESGCTFSHPRSSSLRLPPTQEKACRALHYVREVYG